MALAWEPLVTARSLLVMAAAEARVPAIDVPFIGLDDSDGLAEEACRARQLGFAAKAAIHPAQLPAIHQAFQPTDAEVAEARRPWPPMRLVADRPFVSRGACWKRPSSAATRLC